MRKERDSESAQMAATERKQWVQRLIDEVWNGGNLAAIDDFYAATIVRRQPPFPPVAGQAAYHAFLETTLATFTNLHMTTTEIVVEGNTIVLYGTWSAKQTAPLAWVDLPATGKSFEVAYCTILHLQEDKVVEELVYVDQLGMVQQLRSG